MQRTNKLDLQSYSWIAKGWVRMDLNFILNSQDQCVKNRQAIWPYVVALWFFVFFFLIFLCKKIWIRRYTKSTMYSYYKAYKNQASLDGWPTRQVIVLMSTLPTTPSQQLFISSKHLFVVENFQKSHFPLKHDSLLANQPMLQIPVQYSIAFLKS